VIKKTKTTGIGYYSVRDDISFVSLTVEEERALFIKWREEKNYAARDEIIARHLLYAACEAGKRAPDWIEKDEAISAANAALMKAVARFNPNYGSRFSAYVRKFIRGEIVALCRSKNPVKVPAEWQAEHAIPLDNMDPNMVTPDFQLSEEHPVEGDDHKANQLVKLRLALRRKWITPIERHVIMEHNFNGKDYQTIADEMPKSLVPRASRQRVGQIHKKACAKLKTLLAQYGVDGL